MGECKLQMGQFKEAILYFSYVVRLRPKKIAGWEALIRCLYEAGYYEEARQQVVAALEATGNKPVFYYYLSGVYFALSKPKEALLYLEKALTEKPRILKKLLALNPTLLQNQQVAEVVARLKRRRGGKSQ
jgi:tetratricopeptide (TPR) repeat protein